MYLLFIEGSLFLTRPPCPHIHSDPRELRNVLVQLTHSSGRKISKLLGVGMLVSQVAGNPPQLPEVTGFVRPSYGSPQDSACHLLDYRTNRTRSRNPLDSTVWYWHFLCCTVLQCVYSISYPSRIISSPLIHWNWTDVILIK